MAPSPSDPATQIDRVRDYWNVRIHDLEITRHPVVPVRSRLHGGWKGTLHNTLFVGTFNALPRGQVRRYGWHLLALCRQ